VIRIARCGLDFDIGFGSDIDIGSVT